MTETKLPVTLMGHWETKSGHELACQYATKKRGDLIHSELSDFTIANRVYMAERGDLDLIAWQTAAKERIRWLSVQLALALRAKEGVSIAPSSWLDANDELAANRVIDRQRRLEDGK